MYDLLIIEFIKTKYFEVTKTSTDEINIMDGINFNKYDLGINLVKKNLRLNKESEEFKEWRRPTLPSAGWRTVPWALAVLPYCL
jgi:hypothetical protein